MAVIPADMGVSDARRAYIAISAIVRTALAIGEARATDPAAFPLAPTANLDDWLTRKALAYLIEVGFTPDGWETDYLAAGGGA